MKFALPILTADGVNLPMPGRWLNSSGAKPRAIICWEITKNGTAAFISAMPRHPGAGINIRCGPWPMARWWHFA